MRNEYNMEDISLIHGDNLEGMKHLVDGSVDVILTDPPYLYLKNQKLEREFDEPVFFSECKRVLKQGGFIVLFGRGTSFYRWNTRLHDLGFEFKEEIVWNKQHGSSPLMPMQRVHETISIHSNGKGSINKVKVPYLEMKQHDISSIITDVKRLRTTFKNTKSLDAVLSYLKDNNVGIHDTAGKSTTVSSDTINKANRSVSVMHSIRAGMSEKTIIRSDRHDTDTFTKHGVTTDKRQRGDRCVDVINGVSQGMNEKSIINQVRNHYKSIHPTEKPVRLLERLLALVSKEDDLVLDPFAGSASTAEACINTNRKFIGYEIDEEYYGKAKERLVSVSERIALERIANNKEAEIQEALSRQVTIFDVIEKQLDVEYEQIEITS